MTTLMERQLEASVAMAQRRNGNPGFSSQELAEVRQQMTDIERVLVQGDLSRLTSEQRVTYYNRVCESLDLNPLTRPLEYLNLNGKTLLYARKECTEQLRSRRRISVMVMSREVAEGCYIVTARASMPDGRQDESIGAVAIEGLKGESRANACMKAETKAKRRVTLSICGLGMLDELEVETIPGARVESPPPQLPAKEPAHDADTGEVVDPARPPADAPVAPDENPVYVAYVLAFDKAKDEPEIKRIGQKVANEQKRGNLTLEERAKLYDLSLARKAQLAEMARNKPDAALDTPGPESWGMGGEREPGQEG